MPSYETFKAVLQSGRTSPVNGVDVVWCGDAFIVHVYDVFSKRWEPRFASKSVRKVYRFVAKYVGE